MELLLLSGNSLRNRDWIHEIRPRLGGQFQSTYLQEYQHWQTSEQWIDLPHELTVLQRASQEFATAYGVFAKSIGTVLTAKAMAEAIIKPRFLLLCGLPLGNIVEDYPEFATVIAGAHIPVTVVHNTADPVGSATRAREQLQVAFDGRSDYRFIETPGDTHDYLDLDLLEGELTHLVSLC